MSNSTSTYQQYKADTDFVASWLANTAKACGYSSDLLLPPGPKTNPLANKTGRLKGKARKAAQTLASETSEQVRSYKIALDDFVTLAVYIGKHKPSVRVSTRFFTTIDRAIKLRKERSAMFSGEDYTDKNHEHFIGVLEQVREVLSCLNDDGSSRDDTLSNRFAKLNVQEPSENFQTIPEKGASSNTSPKVSYEAALLDDVHEAYFSFELLLHDFAGARRLIAETWWKYKLGQIDLAAASLTTSTAYDLVKQMEEEAQPVIDKLGGINDIFPRIHQVFSGDSSANQLSPKETYKASAHFFTVGYRFLKHFIDTAVKDERGRTSVKLNNTTHYKELDLTSNRTVKSAREMFLEDRTILSETVRRIMLYMSSPNPNFVDDQLTKDISTMCSTLNISLAVIFGTQTLLDVHHILRDQITRGSSDLRSYTQRLQATIKSNSQFEAALNDSEAQGWGAYKVVRTATAWLLQDSVVTGGSAPGNSKGDPRSLFELHPILSGIWLAVKKTLFHNMSVSFVSGFSPLMYACHAYNALHQEKALTNVWLDMELMLLTQAEGLFVGGRPKSGQDYLNITCLSEGGFLAFLTGKGVKNTNKASKKGHRRLRQLAPVLQIFNNCFFGGYEQTGFREQDVETMLANSEWKHCGESKWSKASAKFKGKKASNQKYSCMAELLRTLCAAIQLENSELDFEYVKLCEACLSFLEEVKDKCGGMLQPVVSCDVESESAHPAATVPPILMALTKTSGDRYNSVAMIADKLISQVFEIMEKHIETGEGGAVYEFMKQLLPGTFVFEDGTFSAHGPAIQKCCEVEKDKTHV